MTAKVSRSLERSKSVSCRWVSIYWLGILSSSAHWPTVERRRRTLPPTINDTGCSSDRRCLCWLRRATHLEDSSPSYLSSAFTSRFDSWSSTRLSLEMHDDSWKTLLQIHRRRTNRWYSSRLSTLFSSTFPHKCQEDRIVKSEWTRKFLVQTIECSRSQDEQNSECDGTTRSFDSIRRWASHSHRSLTSITVIEQISKCGTRLQCLQPG